MRTISSLKASFKEKLIAHATTWAKNLITPLKALTTKNDQIYSCLSHMKIKYDKFLK